MSLQEHKIITLNKFVRIQVKSAIDESDRQLIQLHEYNKKYFVINLRKMCFSLSIVLT